MASSSTEAPPTKKIKLEHPPLLSPEKFNEIKKIWFQVGETGDLHKIMNIAQLEDVENLSDSIVSRAEAKKIRLPDKFTLSLVKVASSDAIISINGEAVGPFLLLPEMRLQHAFAPLENEENVDQVLIRIEGKREVVNLINIVKGSMERRTFILLQHQK